MTYRFILPLAVSACLLSSCVAMLSRQNDVEGFATEAEDGITRRVYYCGTRGGMHFFCLKRGNFPSEYIKIPVSEVSAKGPWPRTFSNREKNWVLLSGSTLRRLEEDRGGKSPIPWVEDAL